MKARSMRTGTHKVSDGFKAFVVDQLEELDVTPRSMFGGVGLYARGVMFGLLSRDRLYLKVDVGTRPAYEAAGMGPFRPYPDSDAMTFSYFGVPVDVLESAPELVVWARKAIAVAERGAVSARSAKAARSRGRRTNASARTRRA